MNVLTIAASCSPYLPSPVGDVVAGLNRALARTGLSVTLVLPLVGDFDPAKNSFARRLAPIAVGDKQVVVHDGRLPNGTVRVIFLEHPELAAGGAAGAALLARGALEAAHQLGAWPDVLHAHDWQAGLAPIFARRFSARPTPKTLFTIHDAAAQGNYPKATVDELGLGWDIFTPDGAELYDQLSLLKAGIAFADRIGALSPRHAKDLLTPAGGRGLEGFLAARADRIVGIQSGVDTEIWNPERDGNLAATYGSGALRGKSACKEALQREAGLPLKPDAPLVVVTGVLSEARGSDLLCGLGDRVVEAGGQLLVAGAGERRFEDALAGVARRNPTQVSLLASTDERLARRALAGGDVALVPARVEPAGTPVLTALRYGTIPVVNAASLGDLIVDYDRETRTGNGFLFDDYTADALLAGLKRATDAFGDREGWDALMARVMKTDHSWDRAARRYADLFATITSPAK